MGINVVRGGVDQGKKALREVAKAAKKATDDEEKGGQGKATLEQLLARLRRAEARIAALEAGIHG